MSIRRRTALTGTAAVAAAPFVARAQGTSRSYAVVSEFARDVRVVIFQESTGTRMGANREDRIPITGNVFDKLALVTAREAIGKSDPQAKTWLVSPLDTDLLDGRNVYAEGSTVRLPDDLMQAMKERGSTHLLAFTPIRDVANLVAATARLGDGQLEGLGFYIDRHAEMKNLDTLVSSKGFIAPYLYMRATLIELPAGKVARMRFHAQGRVIVADRAEQSGDPWNVMSTDEKLRRLSDLVKEQVGRLTSELVAAR